MKVNGQVHVPNSFNSNYYYCYDYYWASKIREDEMGGGRGRYKGENKCILACGWKMWRKETTVKA